MTPDQIKWALSHDWAIREANEYGTRGIWCADRDSAGTESYVFIADFRTLRSWAGY
jgi:hypothetical protein